MTGSSRDASHETQSRRSPSRFKRRRRLRLTLTSVGILLIVSAAGVAWLVAKASTIRAELNAATELVAPLKDALRDNDSAEAARFVREIRAHTVVAKDAAGDPLWALASATPGFGPNFSAVAEVARSADDVAGLGLAPLVRVFDSLDWETMVPSNSGSGLESLELASPTVTSAAHAVRLSAERLEEIDTRGLHPEVSEPLAQARQELSEVTEALNAAADASQLIPQMFGTEAPRSYLLMIQNNAEARSSGGIPGALAVLNIDHGRLTMGAQSSAADVSMAASPVEVDPGQVQIYTSRLGRFMQDVNLTPDFPTAASTAQAMWERKTGQRVDGVISIDPVALSYILDGTGPVRLTQPDLIALAADGLPTELTRENVVKTLLSEVYFKIEEPRLQDVYFAGVAREIFQTLASEQADAEGLVKGIVRGTQEGRVLIWSGTPAEQSIIARYPLSGSVGGPSVAPAQFGVYFNDGTGAKMDYFVKRTVQLVKECPVNGYEQTTVRITSTNTAPLGAGISLPAYVTGNGAFGVPAGSVQTNIIAYGPGQAHVETAKLDGQRTNFAPYFHGDRPVGVLAVLLAPGESKTVDITFGKIAQHSEPNVVVTPTVQPVKDVTLPTENAACG